MTTTYTTFSALPAIQTDTGNFAVSDPSERRGARPTLKPVFCFNHIQIPNGFWFRVCGGHCKTFFTPWNNFDNVRARSA